MKSTPRVPGDRPVMAIKYRDNSRKLLAFISNEGGGSTEAGYPYLYCYPDNYSNIFVCPVARPNLIDRYFNPFNAIDNHNRMRKSDLSVDKYWMTHNGYFILSTTAALGTGIKNGKILSCHSISEGSEDNKISTRGYNERTVYDCFNNPFPDDCGSPYLNLPPITIYDIPHPDKIARYTPDMIPSAISIASEIYVSTLTTPSNSPQVLVLTSDDPNPRHTMKKDNPVHVRVKIGY